MKLLIQSKDTMCIFDITDDGMNVFYDLRNKNHAVTWKQIEDFYNKYGQLWCHSSYPIQEILTDEEAILEMI